MSLKSYNGGGMSASSSAFSEQGQRALELIPHITGSLSMMGSCIIIGRVVWSKRKRQKTYHRLLGALSCSDVISSLSYFLSTWPMIPVSPDENGDDPMNTIGANGTKATCAAQAFGIQFGALCTIFYNVMLSIHYILTIRYNFTEHRLKKQVEPYMLLIPIVLGFVFAITGLLLGTYNNARLWCWIGPDYDRCREMGLANIEECHEKVYMYRWALFYGPCWTSVIIITILQIWLFRTVRQTEKKTQKYTYNNSSSVQVDQQQQQQPSKCKHLEADVDNKNHARDSSNSSSRRRILIIRWLKKRKARNKNKNTSMTRQVARQALLYVLFFYITWVPYTLASLIALVGNRTPPRGGFYLLLLITTFLPLQGLWNLFVYHRRIVTSFINRSIQRCLLSADMISKNRFTKSNKEEAIVIHNNNNDLEDKNSSFKLEKSKDGCSDTVSLQEQPIKEQQVIIKKQETRKNFFQLHEDEEQKENNESQNDTKEVDVTTVDNAQINSHDHLTISRRLSSMYGMNID